MKILSPQTPFARQWNRLVDMVRELQRAVRQSSNPPESNPALDLSRFLHVEPPLELHATSESVGLRLAGRVLFNRVALTEPLYRDSETPASATPLVWAGDEWIEHPDAAPLNLHADLWAGFGFAGDHVLARYQVENDRWQAVGTGHSILRGTADEEIGPGESGDVVLAGGMGTITAHNRYSAESAVVAEDAVVYVVWSTQDQTWDILTADCG